ncbi:hypothetical protein LOD99_4194 [Oopsacas minuta]|uniref:WIBG Mago-binding domain-containing protein n=1 Tax=Oopsacas minuta TaxID=111878 RepID=A0AAV7JVM7_9METZ|nr:hypothetical protein LOD99_4194 [Oopsacas minuta]
MATGGYRVIQRALRPDGTPRKPIKVKEGYLPPDETDAYVPPHRVAQTNDDYFPTKMIIEESPTIQLPKTKNQIKNERKRKNKKEKKLLNQSIGSPEHNDHLFPKELSDKGAFQNGISNDDNPLETIKSKKKVQTSGATKSNEATVEIIKSKNSIAGTKDSKHVEISDELSEQNKGLEKQIHKLRKKLDQVDKLLSKDTLNEEEEIKVGKKGEWVQEMKTIESQLQALNIK